MISKKDIDKLYVWAKQTKFLTKDAPTVSGYTPGVRDIEPVKTPPAPPPPPIELNIPPPPGPP